MWFSAPVNTKKGLTTYVSTGWSVRSHLGDMISEIEGYVE
jgi:hypothetical protein